MSYIKTGGEGIPNREIIAQLGNKKYEIIDFRCNYKDRSGKDQDFYYGSGFYDNTNEKLVSADGGHYSLDDLYIIWKEACSDGKYFLTVWEAGQLEDDIEGLYKKY